MAQRMVERACRASVFEENDIFGIFGLEHEWKFARPSVTASRRLLSSNLPKEVRVNIVCDIKQKSCLTAS